MSKKNRVGRTTAENRSQINITVTSEEQELLAEMAEKLSVSVPRMIVIYFLLPALEKYRLTGELPRLTDKITNELLFEGLREIHALLLEQQEQKKHSEILEMQETEFKAA